MYRRLIILSVIILGALCGLVVLGYHSVGMWARGLAGERAGEFAAVAEQIRNDVNRKLDEFREKEESRPYTDYQYYYIPDNTVGAQEQVTMLRSPLAGKLETGLAYGQFQIDPDGNITTPNDRFAGRTMIDDDRDSEFYAKVESNRDNVWSNLLPALTRDTAGTLALGFQNNADSVQTKLDVSRKVQVTANELIKKQAGKVKTSQSFRGKNLPIESFQRQGQEAQVFNRSRALLEQSLISNSVVATSGAGTLYESGTDNVQMQLEDSSQMRRTSSSSPGSNERSDRQTQTQTGPVGGGYGGGGYRGMGNIGAGGSYPSQERKDVAQIAETPPRSPAQKKPGLAQSLLTQQSDDVYDMQTLTSAPAKDAPVRSKGAAQVRQEAPTAPTEPPAAGQDAVTDASQQAESSLTRKTSTERNRLSNSEEVENQGAAQHARTATPYRQDTVQLSSATQTQPEPRQQRLVPYDNRLEADTSSTQAAVQGEDLYNEQQKNADVSQQVQMPQAEGRDAGWEAALKKLETLSKDSQFKVAEDQTDMVQVRIEPFVPLVVPCKAGEHSVFGGQVFMLRHVQIEDKHFVQGFQLNEKELIKEVEESARNSMRDRMDFELAPKANGNSAYTAILDFGFGSLILNLIETDPGWISRKISGIRMWYFSIITVVFLAVTLGLTSLWHNARAQLRLARKKDDFISAVSHELRTPLTSIRMYSEMLEKNWVKSKDKVTEYYKNMRAESERLSRLIENVLDFSRIQRGRKKYAFNLGDMNRCIADVVEMMRPYAAQNGFSIRTEFAAGGQATFDADAVTQIVVNLLDNAVKYARQAEDKTITVRTKDSNQFIVIEVEDHGPGVPHRQRKKIFEEFYRIGAEATRETTGTGLGLALVKKFAQAHDGFVEILGARPSGAIFRVGLAAQI